MASTTAGGTRPCTPKTPGSPSNTDGQLWCPLGAVPGPAQQMGTDSRGRARAIYGGLSPPGVHQRPCWSDLSGRSQLPLREGFPVRSLAQVPAARGLGLGPQGRRKNGDSRRLRNYEDRTCSTPTRCRSVRPSATMYRRLSPTFLICGGLLAVWRLLAAVTKSDSRLVRSSRNRLGRQECSPSPPAAVRSISLIRALGRCTPINGIWRSKIRSTPGCSRSTYRQHHDSHGDLHV